MNELNFELYHHGIKGQQWGVRRFQNEDGSLTDAGEKRYNESLTKTYENDNDNDYNISKGSIVARRTSSVKDVEGNGDSKYTYTYDYDNTTDDNFYKQFGKKVTEYEFNDNAVLAGRKTLGKAFVDKMLKLEDENDIDAMDTLYSEARSRLGKNYVEDLFTVPYNPNKHMEALEAAGADMVARMLSKQRNEAFDAKMKRKGFRDPDTAANDIGRDIVDRLVSDGYSGMRDYNDYGSAAAVTTPTVLFNPGTTLSQLRSWIEE